MLISIGSKNVFFLLENANIIVIRCSQTGKRLMAKCRMLLQENEDLGRSMSSGRIAKLEGDIALQKRLIDEMKNSEKGLVFYFEFVSCYIMQFAAYYVIL